MQVLTNTGPLGTTGVHWSANVADLDGLLLTVKSIAGSTVVVESSPDNSAWTAVNGFAISPAGVLSNNAGSITALGRYWFPCDTNYIRVRVSAYVGPGLVDIDEDVSTVSLRSLTSMLLTGLVALGNSQATALPIQAVFNQFATVAASTGAILPAGLSRNQEIVIRNGGANALSVYPPVGGAINGGTVNAALSVGAGTSVRLISDGAGNFWSF